MSLAEVKPNLGIRGIDLSAAVKRLYLKGRPRGHSTGWLGLDELYTVGVGQWTVVTGTPNSGKSEFLDALMVNLAETSKWRFVVYSPENQPYEEHLAKLIEKRVRKPFGAGPNERVSAAELERATAWVDEHFLWVPDVTMSPPEVLYAATQMVLERGWGMQPWGVVIDPWNYLDHNQGGKTEAQYLSGMLSHISSFARSNAGHVWVVAHPRVLEKNRDGKRSAPTPYDINGGAMWFNKADHVLCVHCDRGEAPRDVYIHSQKARFKRYGTIGVAKLGYDTVTGRYSCQKSMDAYREVRGREPGCDDE